MCMAAIATLPLPPRILDLAECICTITPITTATVTTTVITITSTGAITASSGTACGSGGMTIAIGIVRGQLARRTATTKKWSRVSYQGARLTLEAQEGAARRLKVRAGKGAKAAQRKAALAYGVFFL
jgi:hypothetical protein